MVYKEKHVGFIYKNNKITGNESWIFVFRENTLSRFNPFYTRIYPRNYKFLRSKIQNASKCSSIFAAKGEQWTNNKCYVILLMSIHCPQMVISWNGGTPKWMVYTGRSYIHGWFRGILILGNPNVKNATNSNFYYPPLEPWSHPLREEWLP